MESWKWVPYKMSFKFNYKILIIIFLDRQSLHNLKHHFAKNGCPDTQYDVALQLLESNASPEPDGSESITDAQGVYWLLSAANQGHEEALEKLRECFEKRRGITDYNETDVRSCLEMSSSERASRKAAKVNSFSLISLRIIFVFGINGVVFF